jgi:hypothetical protein
VSSPGSRTAQTGLRSALGRPRGFIVFAIKMVCQKTEPMERSAASALIN